MTDDELIEMRQAPPKPLAPKVQSLTGRPVPPIPAPDVMKIATSKAPPKPAPNVYEAGEGLGNNWTYFFIVILWLMTLIVAFFVGGILL